MELPSPLLAQEGRSEADVLAGGTWFADDSLISHAIVGGTYRWRLSPRLTLGPEATYMIGPGTDRDVMLTGQLTFVGRAAGLSPFVTAGGGLYHHRSEFLDRRYRSNAGILNFGGGVRVPLTQGWHLAPEFRFGLGSTFRSVGDPHVRLQIGVGRRL